MMTMNELIELMTMLLVLTTYRQRYLACGLPLWRLSLSENMSRPRGSKGKSPHKRLITSCLTSKDDGKHFNNQLWLFICVFMRGTEMQLSIPNNFDFSLNALGSQGAATSSPQPIRDDGMLFFGGQIVWSLIGRTKLSVRLTRVLWTKRVYVLR